MDEQVGTEGVHEVYDRLQSMLGAVQDGEEVPTPTLAVLEELSAGVEELRLAEEELRAQSKQLAAAVATLDQQREHDRLTFEAQVGVLSDEVELLSDLAEVQRLVEGEDPLAATLSGIVELAQRTVPDCEISLSLVGRPDVERRLSSGPLARRIDDLQRQAGQGPSVEALRSSTVVRGRPEDWPVLGTADGVTEIVGIPMVSNHDMGGALNVYVLGEPLADHAVHLLQLLAEQATVAIANAHLFASSSALVSGLARALETRGVIERAKGLLMARQGCTEDEAFHLLRQASQRENVKLHLVAARLVAGTPGARS